MVPRRIVRALIRLSDPDGVDGPTPPVADIPLLCEVADTHSVLPAVVSNLHRIAGDRFAEALAGPRRQLLQRAAVSMLLRRQLGEITTAFARHEVPAAVIKGPAFADRLYTDPALRPFTDLDLLVEPDRRDDAAVAMERLGYRLCDQPGRKYDTVYGEQTWRRPDPGRSGGAVEIHWNLVNSPALRAGLSVGYSDLVTDGALSAAALLIVAAVHGATSHQFDRLGLLWDIAQAARGHAGEIDGRWLVETIDRTGGGRAVAMGLHLVARMLGEPAPESLRRRLELSRPGFVTRWLLTPSVVMGTRAPLVTARRLAFRQMLKRS